MAKSINEVQAGHYVVGRYMGQQEQNGYPRILVAMSDSPEARPVEFSFKAFSQVDGTPTVDGDVEVGDLVIVSVYNEVQLYEVGKKAGNPTGEWAGFIKRSANHVSKIG